MYIISYTLYSHTHSFFVLALLFEQSSPKRLVDSHSLRIEVNSSEGKWLSTTKDAPGFAFHNHSTTIQHVFLCGTKERKGGSREANARGGCSMGTTYALFNQSQ